MFQLSKSQAATTLRGKGSISAAILTWTLLSAVIALSSLLAVAKTGITVAFELDW